MTYPCTQEHAISAIRREIELLESSRETDQRAVLDRLEDVSSRLESVGERLDVVGARVALLTEWRREQRERRMTWRTIAIAILPALVTATGAWLVASHSSRHVATTTVVAPSK